jgi:hypothetical protein
MAKAVLIDDDTIRTGYQLYQEDGIEGLASFGHEGGGCRPRADQLDQLRTWIAETPPRSTREVGAWIAAEFGIEYRTRSGLIALLHRLGMEHPIFMDAVHPTHAVRPIGCRAPKDVAVAIEPGSGLDRLTIHGAIDLETGRTIM